MAVPKRKGNDIETKARHSYFRAKLRNDHEMNMLHHRLGHLHYQTVTTLEGHWRNTMDVVEIFKGCQKTSGLSPVGIKPTKQDTRETLLDLHAKTVPWAHFSKYSMESWHRFDEDGVYYGRPRTAQDRRNQTADMIADLTVRPKTALPQTSVTPTSTANGPEVTEMPDTPPQIFVKNSDTDKQPSSTESEQHNRQSGLQSPWQSSRTRMVSSSNYRRVQLAQLRAKTATMTRKKFIDLDNSGPMYNRNVASACKRITPANDPWYAESVEDESSRCYPDVKDLNAWDLETLRKQYRTPEPEAKRRTHDGTPSAQTSRLPKPLTKSVSSMDNDHSGRSNNDPEKESSIIMMSTTAPPRKMSVVSYNRSPSDEVQDISRTPTKSKNDSVETDPKPQPVNSKLEKISGQCLSKHANKPSEPKFYVRPQDRHNMNQSFLMKRYFFLQRQMNKNHGMDADALTQAGTALVVNPTLSRSARLKVLHTLMDEYDSMQKRQLGPDPEELIRAKVKCFIQKVTEFIENTKEEGTRAWEEKLRLRKLEDQRREQAKKSRKQLR